jgi:hypothetical protein
MKNNFTIKSGLTILVLLLLISCDVFAQAKANERKRFKDKIFYGGSIGLMLGTSTRIDILPEVGMWIIPQCAIGIGGRYSYWRERANVLNGVSKPFSSHLWGVSAFTDLVPIQDLDKAFKIGIHGGPIFHAEWEGIYLDKGMFDPSSSNGKGWVHLIIAGGGYRFPIGRKAAFNLLLLWDLTNNRYSPYTTNPIMRISISF